MFIAEPGLFGICEGSLRRIRRLSCLRSVPKLDRRVYGLPCKFMWVFYVKRIWYFYSRVKPMPATKKKQYLTDQSGKRVGVVLDIDTYQKMQDDLDDYYCRKSYQRAKPSTDAEIKRGDFVTIDEIAAERRARKQNRNGGHNGKKR